MHGSVAVIRSVQRAQNHRRNCGVRGRIEDVSQAARGRAEIKEERKLRMARNAELPRLDGLLVENSRGLLGGESEQLRWVVLDPPEATLSIWDKPPREAVPSFGDRPCNSSNPSAAKGHKKVYSVDKLVEVDSNPSFRKIFLRFEGASLCLSATREEDFHHWMSALSVYDANAAKAPHDIDKSLPVEHYAEAARLLSQSPARFRRCFSESQSPEKSRGYAMSQSSFGESQSPQKRKSRSLSRSLGESQSPEKCNGRMFSPPRRQTSNECREDRSQSPLRRQTSKERREERSRKSPGSPTDFQTAFNMCYVVEPNPEPLPDLDGPGFYEDRGHGSLFVLPRPARWLMQEEYDPGTMEAKAVMPSMGIMDHRKGLVR